MLGLRGSAEDPDTIKTTEEVKDGYHHKYLVIDKADIGLGRADNTPDTEKDVATARTLKTARDLTIGLTALSFDGSRNLVWSLADIGALPAAGGTITGNYSRSNIAAGDSAISLTGVSNNTKGVNISNLATGIDISVPNTSTSKAINVSIPNNGYGMYATATNGGLPIRIDKTGSNQAIYIYNDSASNGIYLNTTPTISQDNNYVPNSGEVYRFAYDKFLPLAGGMITGNLKVNGTTTLDSTLSVTGATTLSSTLSVTDAVTLSSTLAVTGAATLSGTLDAKEAVTVGNSSKHSLTTLHGNLNIKNGSTNKFTVAYDTGNTSIAGTLGVTGNTSLGGTLGVTGNTTLGGTLGVTGATTLSSLSTTGNVSIAGTLGVTKATTLSNTLGVTGATTLSSTLSVTGATTLNSTLDVAGNTTVGSTSKHSITTLHGNLYVYNGSTVKFSVAYSTGNAAIVGDLNVGGATVLASTLTVAGNSTISGTLGVTGKITASGNLEVAGTTSLSGEVNITNNVNIGTASSHPTTTLHGNLNIKNGSTNKFTVAYNTGNTSIAGTLGVTENTTLGGTLGVTGNTTVGGTLSVSGSSTFSGAVTIGTTSNNKNLNVYGNIYKNSYSVLTTADLNGTSSSYYSPTSAGTAGNILYSTAGTPAWSSAINCTNNYVKSVLVGTDDRGMYSGLVLTGNIPSSLSTDSTYTLTGISIGSSDNKSYVNITDDMKVIHTAKFYGDIQLQSTATFPLSVNGSNKYSTAKTIYAPTSSGTNGYGLFSSGSEAPIWSNAIVKSSDYGYLTHVRIGASDKGIFTSGTYNSSIPSGYSSDSSITLSGIIIGDNDTLQSGTTTITGTLRTMSTLNAYGSVNIYSGSGTGRFTMKANDSTINMNVYGSDGEANLKLTNTKSSTATKYAFITSGTNNSKPKLELLESNIGITSSIYDDGTGSYTQLTGTNSSKLLAVAYDGYAGVMYTGSASSAYIKAYSSTSAEVYVSSTAGGSGSLHAFSNGNAQVTLVGKSGTNPGVWFDNSSHKGYVSASADNNLIFGSNTHNKWIAWCNASGNIGIGAITASDVAVGPSTVYSKSFNNSYYKSIANNLVLVGNSAINTGYTTNWTLPGNQYYIIITWTWTTGVSFGMWATMLTAGNTVTTISGGNGCSVSTDGTNGKIYVTNQSGAVAYTYIYCMTRDNISF